MNADIEPAAKLLADAHRRVTNAGRARAGAIAGIQTQERAIAALRERGQDTTAAETLLEHFRAIFQRSEDELGRLTAEHSELADRPRWRLNDG